MEKLAYFDRHWGVGWPTLAELEPVFLSSEYRKRFFAAGRDGGSFVVKGLGRTDGLPPRPGRIDVQFFVTLNRSHGAYLVYAKWDGGARQKYSYDSKGDLRRLREFVRTFHGTPLPVGLFIPFTEAWLAVKEFIETEGELPTSIEWIATSDLPPGTFPDPYLLARGKTPK